MPAKCNVPDNWPVEPGVYLLGNKYHPVAVLVPSDDELGKTLLQHAIDMGVAIAGFCKTTCIGIEKVICNILANPNIRWLIIAGHESTGYKSGKAIVMLHRYGVDPKTRRILCGPNMPCKDIPTGYIPNLPLSIIERFRRQVTVVDLIVDNVDVREDNVVELMCKVIYSCVQEPWNKVVMKIKGVEYTLFDPGAFDTEPFHYTIMQSLARRYIEIVDESLAILIVDTVIDLANLLSELESRKIRKIANLVIHILKSTAEYSLNLDVESYGKFSKIHDAIIALIQDKLSREAEKCDFTFMLTQSLGENTEMESLISLHISIHNSKVHITVHLRQSKLREIWNYSLVMRSLLLEVCKLVRQLGHDVEPGTITIIVSDCQS